MAPGPLSANTAAEDGVVIVTAEAVVTVVAVLEADAPAAGDGKAIAARKYVIG